MVEHATAKHDEKDATTQRDLAPAGSGATLGRGELGSNLTTEPTQNLLKTETVKRQKTAGEKLFDISVYGGIMWGVNEVLSTIIGRGVTKGEGTLENISKAAFKKPEVLKNLFDKVAKGPLRAPLTIFVLTSGGNLLVPVTKFLEDYKGKIVRWTDGWLESKDPKHRERLEQAHTEMDNAPKQSWATLWEGRLIVLAAAVGIDLLIGGKDAPSTKLFKGEKMQDWSSMTRASTALARKLGGWLKPEMRQTIANAKALSPHLVIESVESAMKNPDLQHHSKETLMKAVEGKKIGFVADNSFVLVLSAVTAFCFYLTSKFFARKRDEKQAAPETAARTSTPATSTGPRAHTEQLAMGEEPARDDAAQPSTRIAAAQMQDRLHAAPLHAQVAG